tara:strand:+ start:219 stop:452 length:234 start_codon:yes stop_codon:yes gene_type:complete
MKISRISMISGETNTMDIDVTHEQLNAWVDGELIQNAMPNLSADEHEFIKTGITSQEWENLTDVDYAAEDYFTHNRV